MEWSVSGVGPHVPLHVTTVTELRVAHGTVECLHARVTMLVSTEFGGRVERLCTDVTFETLLLVILILLSLLKDELGQLILEPIRRMRLSNSNCMSARIAIRWATCILGLQNIDPLYW